MIVMAFVYRAWESCNNVILVGILNPDGTMKFDSNGFFYRTWESCNNVILVGIRKNQLFDFKISPNP